MKSLQTIQKTFRIFQTLTKVMMVLSFVWAGLAALGLLCGIVWYNGGSVVGADQGMLLALTDGTLLAFALHYFKAEQADGTPFTKRGADEIRRLGIRTIVLPLVAAILAATVHAVFHLPANAGSDWSNAYSLTMGIVLILASLVFRYGAELEEKAG